MSKDYTGCAWTTLELGHWLTMHLRAEVDEGRRGIGLSAAAQEAMAGRLLHVSMIWTHQRSYDLVAYQVLEEIERATAQAEKMTAWGVGAASGHVVHYLQELEKDVGSMLVPWMARRAGR